MGSVLQQSSGPVQGVRLCRVTRRESALIFRIPYVPFSKSDKISRIADWHEPALDMATGQRRQAYASQGRRAGREAFGASEANAFGYVHDEDEKSFSLVDSGNRPAARGRSTMRGASRGRGFQAGRGGRGRGTGFQPRGGFAGRGRGRGGYWGDRNQVRIAVA